MFMITVPPSIENADMKSLATILSVAFLISSCSGDDSDSNPLNDGTAPLFPGITSSALDDDDIMQFGTLSELIGSVGVSYSFTGTEPVLGLQLEFTADSFSIDDTGAGLLFSEADEFSVPSPGAEPISGSTSFFGCSYNEDVNEFLCILNPGEDSQSLFRFDRISNGSAQGIFEFCIRGDTSSCATALLSAPDGAAVIAVSNLIAVSRIADRASASEIDLQPYLEYLKQGSSDDVVTVHTSSSHVETMTAMANSLRNSLMTK